MSKKKSDKAPEAPTTSRQVAEVGESMSPAAALATDDGLRAFGRLVAGIAHEVNNPLTFVLANIEGLRETAYDGQRFLQTLRKLIERGGPISPEELSAAMAESGIDRVAADANEMMGDCYKGIQRIQEVTRSLGTISRANDKTPEMVDLARIVDDACAMVYNQVRYRARLVKRFEATPMVAAYPGRIAQALVNMLVNAAESIAFGSHDDNRIVISTHTSSDEIYVSIIDTGRGIDQAHVDRVFEPGFTTKREGGSGLGLPACLVVAEQHRGRIEVAAVQPRGTRFSLVIPIDTGLVAAVRQAESTRPLSELPSESRRILIVDDDEMVLSAFARRLRRRYDVVTANSGNEALVRLGQDAAFDVILCDLMMPGVDGKAFYEAVERHHPELAGRIVFMSGGAFTPRLRRFASVVPNAVMQKPVNKKRLAQLLSEAANHRTDD